MKCLNCDKVLKQARNTKKFCDTKCRVAYNRKNIDNVELNKGSKKVTVKEIAAITPKVKEAVKPKVIGKPYEPKEGSGAFFLKHGVMTKAEIKPIK